MKIIYLLLMFVGSQTLLAQDHIHLGSTGNPLDGLTISWRSQSSGNQIKWGYTTTYEQGAFVAVRRDDYNGNLYDYTFPTLMPSSTIHYKLYVDGEWQRATRSFQTSTDTSSTQFSFIAGGDSRSNLSDWQIAANMLATDSVDFHLFLGDHVNSGTSTPDWDNWYSNGTTFLENNLLYHTAGNHEFGSIYLNQFVMPENEKWYSFEFGNAIFICLLSEEAHATQHAWLVDKLATTTKTWKIVFFHIPFFSPGSHADDMNDYRETWWKAFDDFGVDLVLNAHEHFYLRSKPINLNISDTSAVPGYGSNIDEGRLQIISGSYGAPLYSAAPGWFVESNISVMHYTKVDINDNELAVNAYSMEGALLDNVTLSKQSAANTPADHSAVPTKLILNQNYPNPFNSNTTINFTVPTDSNVSLDIYDLQGNRVTTLGSWQKISGSFSVTWNGTNETGENVPTGLYLTRLQVGSSMSIVKMLLLK